jgi:tetratricopeptide (TPR) repeat protein
LLNQGAAARSADKPKSRAAIGFAIAAIRGGNVAKGRMMLHDRLLADPDDASALSLLAEIAVDEGQFDQATVFLRRAATADPSPQFQISLVRHMHKYGSPGMVLKEIENLAPAVRSEQAIMSIEAVASGAVGDHDRQIALYEQLARRSPRNPSLWKSLGNALKTVGRFDAAVAAIRRSIKVQPTYGDAYWSLANFKSFKFSERDINVMKRNLTTKLSAEDALHLHFALGKAYEDTKQFEASFEHYAAGNALRAASVNEEHEWVSNYVDRAIESLNGDLLARNRASGCRESGPIFVLGMHRSGSTLVEQILASHPLVEGTTELAVMNQIRDRIRHSSKSRGSDYWHALTELKDSDLEQIGQEYLDRTRPYRRTDRPYFIDKMPSNWLSLALIRLSLPNAIIIDARRHPLACGFSNFKQNYASGATYTYTLPTMGRFYHDYWRFMRHFDSIEPGAVYRVINERLIESPEPIIRGLLDHCGLPFEPACLEFHKNTRAVRTPSAEQVRRPINRDGVDTWRHYEQWLDPLKAALGPTLHDWEN